MAVVTVPFYLVSLIGIALMYTYFTKVSSHLCSAYANNFSLVNSAAVGQLFFEHIFYYQHTGP